MNILASEKNTVRDILLELNKTFKLKNNVEDYVDIVCDLKNNQEVRNVAIIMAFSLSKNDHSEGFISTPFIVIFNRFVKELSEAMSWKYGDEFKYETIDKTKIENQTFSELDSEIAQYLEVNLFTLRNIL